MVCLTEPCAFEKNITDCSIKCFYRIAILLLLILSNPAIKSVRHQKGHCEKRCEIQGGGQEMAVMVG